MRHLQLFFEIGEHAQPSQQHLSPSLPGIGNGETVVVIDINVAQMADRSLNLLDALIGREHWHLVRVAGHQDNYPFKQATAAGNNV